jgi:tetratricopeptide (TPR) repeat protein
MARHEEVSVRNCEDKLNANPQSLVFSRLADGYRKQGEIQKAVDVCMQGLQFHPDYVTGRVILGRCYLEQEKLDEAITEFIQAIQLDRRNQVAIKMIADIYVRQGMKEKAGDLYGYLLRMDPGNRSLEKLIVVNPGGGETSIYSILNITAETAVPKVSADTVTDPDNTARIDMPSDEEMDVVPDDADTAQSVPLDGKPSADESNPTDNEYISGDDVKNQLNDMFSGASLLEETPEETGGKHDQQLHDAAPEFASGEASPGIVGNNAAFGFDTIFEEIEKPDAPEWPAVENSANTTDDKGMVTITEDSDGPIVIDGDLSGKDGITAGDDTLFDVETSITGNPGRDRWAAEENSEENIDIVLPEKVSSDEMSGDDLIGRMEELFPSDTMEDAGREKVPENDEGNGAAADDGTVNAQGTTATDVTVAGDDGMSQYSIPDHVLTPTLADIYFQQGQPKLALQIYTRLLEVNPDNERITARIQEIKRQLAMQDPGGTDVTDSRRNKIVSPAPLSDEGASATGKNADNTVKPLSGVRIKKKYRNRKKGPA